MAQTTSSYSIALVNDGVGNLTPTARRNPTQASGGTALTIPWVQNTNAGTADTSSLLPGVAIQAAMRAIVNDIAAGN